MGEGPRVTEGGDCPLTIGEKYAIGVNMIPYRYLGDEEGISRFVIATRAEKKIEELSIPRSKIRMWEDYQILTNEEDFGPRILYYTTHPQISEEEREAAKGILEELETAREQFKESKEN